MSMLRDLVLETLQDSDGLTASEIAKRVVERLPETNPESVRVTVYRELKRLVANGLVERVGERWKLVGGEHAPQPQPETCFNCGEPLDGKLWHRCREPNSYTNHRTRVTLIKWDGSWLPLAERFQRWKNPEQGDYRTEVFNRCVFCGAEMMVRDGCVETLNPIYATFPVRCESCGNTILVLVDLVAEGLVL